MVQSSQYPDAIGKGFDVLGIKKMFSANQHLKVMEQYLLL